MTVRYLRSIHATRLLYNPQSFRQGFHIAKENALKFILNSSDLQTDQKTKIMANLTEILNDQPIVNNHLQMNAAAMNAAALLANQQSTQNLSGYVSNNINLETLLNLNRAAVNLNMGLHNHAGTNGVNGAAGLSQNNSANPVVQVQQAQKQAQAAQVQAQAQAVVQAQAQAAVQQQAQQISAAAANLNVLNNLQQNLLSPGTLVNPAANLQNLLAAQNQSQVAQTVSNPLVSPSTSVVNQNNQNLVNLLQQNQNLQGDMSQNLNASLSQILNSLNGTTATPQTDNNKNNLLNNLSGNNLTPQQILAILNAQNNPDGFTNAAAQSHENISSPNKQNNLLTSPKHSTPKISLNNKQQQNKLPKLTSPVNENKNQNDSKTNAVAHNTDSNLRKRKSSSDLSATSSSGLERSKDVTPHTSSPENLQKSSSSMKRMRNSDSNNKSNSLQNLQNNLENPPKNAKIPKTDAELLASLSNSINANSHHQIQNNSNHNEDEDVDILSDGEQDIQNSSTDLKISPSTSSGSQDKKPNGTWRPW